MDCPNEPRTNSVSPQAQSKLYVVGSSDEYRKLAREITTPADQVLEIGCASGDATAALARRAASVLAVDISQTILAEARTRCAQFDNCEFREFDARGIFLLKKEHPHFDLVFADIGGDAPIGRVTTLLLDIRSYYPAARATVMRSLELSVALDGLQSVEQLPQKLANRYLIPRSPLEVFYSYAASPERNNRIFAARLLTKISAPQGAQETEFTNTVARLQNDPAMSVRYFSRQFKL